MVSVAVPPADQKSAGREKRVVMLEDSRPPRPVRREVGVVRRFFDADEGVGFGEGALGGGDVGAALQEFGGKRRRGWRGRASSGHVTGREKLEAGLPIRVAMACS